MLICDSELEGSGTMTVFGARRPDCPPWCASDHTGTDETGRPVPHFGEHARPRRGSLVSVCPALLESGDGRPEVILDRTQRPGEAKTQATWVRLHPDQAGNLAAILDESGDKALAGLIRQALAVIAPASGT
jgi:hypothetical protein